MPLYQYECDQCKAITEEFFKIAEKPDTVPCDCCGGVAGKILSAGLVLGDDMPHWMRQEQTLGCLQPMGDKSKIKTRSDYNAYLKKHNIGEYSPNSEI